MNKNGAETVYTYDANGNTLQVKDTLNGTVSYTYNNMNRVVTTTDKLGATTTYTYDAAGNVVRTTDALTAYATSEYDANSNLIRATNRANEWVKYDYDEMNRLVKETNQLNNAVEYEYDLVGNQVAVLDGNHHRTAYAYDGLNRIASVTDATGGITAYTYDYLGNLATLTVDGGNNARAATTYAYDLAGNLLTETSPLGNVTSYSYDKEGNAVRKTDENGVVTTYAYDTLYHLTSRTDPDGTASYTYDGMSNLVTAEDANGTVAFTYDALSRTTGADNEDGSNTAYTYDAAGNRLSITYPDATAVTTTYNTLGNVSSFMDYDGSGTTYTRDAEGRVTKESHGDGSTTEYAYNAAGQLTMQKEVTANNTTRRQIAYAYDDAGNLTSENRSGVDIDKKDELVRYYYDAADRLIKTSIEGVTTDYSYDKAGNLLSDGAYTYTYDQQNRLLSKTGTDGATNYTYDAAGNLMKETGPDGTTTYTYSAQNKLVLGEKDDGQSSAYTYNAMGARIENTQVRENQNAGYQNSNLIDGSSGVDYMEYLQDLRASLQRVWETEAGTTVQNNYETVTKHYIVDYLSAANRDILVTEDGSFTQRYVYDASGTRISAEFDYADGTHRGESGENLQSDFAANDMQKVWYRTSLVSSTLFAVDDTGAVISHMIYDPWGNPLSETYTDTNLSGIDNLNNYTGYTWDETLGLYYAQNRFYDAENHRFTQEDIIKSGSNWHIYCENSPLIYVDVLGFDKDIAGQNALRTKLLEYSESLIWPDGNLYVTNYNILYNEFGDSYPTIEEYYEKLACHFGVTKDWLMSVLALDYYMSKNASTDPITIIETEKEINIFVYCYIHGDQADETIPGNDNKKYRELAIEGIKNCWDGSYQSKTVNVYVIDVNDGKDYYINEKQGFLDIEIKSVKAATDYSYASGWSSFADPGYINLYIGDGRSTNTTYSVSQFAATAGHEFGHALGIGDAYNGNQATINDVKSPSFYAMMDSQFKLNTYLGGTATKLEATAQYVDYSLMLLAYQAYQEGQSDSNSKSVMWQDIENSKEIAALLEKWYKEGNLTLQ